MLAADLSFEGLGLETVPGTAVAATGWPIFTSFEVDDDIAWAADIGQRGSMVTTYGQTATNKHSDIDCAGSIYPDSFGYLLASLLPDITVTGASAPFSHAMSIKNTGTAQPKGLSVYASDVADLRYYAGAVVSDIEIDFSSDGLLAHASKLVGYPGVVAGQPDRNGTNTPAGATRSYTAVPQMGAWRGAATLGGTATGRIMDGKIALKRPVTDSYSVGGASANATSGQYPYQIFSGPLQTTGSLNIYMESAQVDYLAYLNGTVQAFTLAFSQGAGATQNGLALQMTQALFTNGKVDTVGKDMVMLAVDFEAFANTTDAGASAGYSPIKATITSASPSGTYQ